MQGNGSPLQSESRRRTVWLMLRKASASASKLPRSLELTSCRVSAAELVLFLKAVRRAAASGAAA